VSILPLLTAVTAFAGRPFSPVLINKKSSFTPRALFTARMSESSKPLIYVDVSILRKVVMEVP